MGGGTWTRDAFTSYTASTKAYASVSLDGTITGISDNAQDVFKSRGIAAELKPMNVMRECLDTAEHPNTIPVILALDVTGSMGGAAVEVAKKLNVIMTSLYEKVKDVEFLVMGIGDLAYDNAPIQASQFESDIRIAEQLDKIFFEGGGGGNAYESYTAAWYFGVNHTKLDCWKRNKKGIIITMGDEPLNPYLPYIPLHNVTGDSLQADIDTKDLYEQVIQKYDVYHLVVNDTRTAFRYKDRIHASFGKYLDGQHLIEVTLDSLANTIVDIVTNASDSCMTTTEINSNGEISW